MKPTKPTPKEQLYDYLDRLRGGAVELDFDDLNDNAWQMFERSVGDPTEVVCRWIIERGVTVKRKVERVITSYVEFDPQLELASRVQIVAAKGAKR